MADWFKKISSLISTDESLSPSENSDIQVSPSMLSKLEHLTPSDTPETLEGAHSLSFSKLKAPSAQQNKTSFKTPVRKENAPIMNVKDDTDDSLKALKHLRELPRGTHEDSRISAIQNLLAGPETFNTLKKLRWPKGVVCPVCRSSNIVIVSPPSSATDDRHYYECLNCQKDGGKGSFDDFTGLPIKSFNALRQWVLCWYLIGFCSVGKIAKVLGLSPQEVVQLATLGSELTDLPDAEEKQQLSAKDKQDGTHKSHRKDIDQMEESTRSASKSPLKPGYKSKK